MKTIALYAAVLSALVVSLLALHRASDDDIPISRGTARKFAAQFPSATPAPLIDLRSYGVVANDNTKAASNTAAINTAIAAWTGTGATLMLPVGIIYIDRSVGSGNKWSVEFNGTTDETFAGQGMFATTLVRYGPGDAGSSHEIHVDGAARIELRDFAIRQDQLLSPDAGQQNHLITVTNGSTDIYGHDIYFGKSIGDQLRFIGGTGGPGSGIIHNVHFSHFLMHGAGVVTSSPGNGRVGSRSGFSVQNGWNHVEVDHFYIDGVENSGIDFEPTTATQMTYFDIHDGTVDNSLASSLTSHAVSIGGVSGGSENVTHVLVSNLTILEGAMNVFDSVDLQLRRVSILSTVAMAGGSTYMLQVRDGNDDLLIKDVYLSRTGTSDATDDLNILNTGSSTTVDGGEIIQGTVGYPLFVQDSTNTRIRNLRILYTASSASGKDAIALESINASMDAASVDNVQASTSSGKLESVVNFTVRSPRVLSNISATRIKSAGYATTSVLLSKGSGSTMDLAPLIKDISNGTDLAWSQVDAGNNPITTLFAVVGGSSASGTTRAFEGAETPESNCTGTQGDTYAFKNGDATDLYRKATGTSTTGWKLIPRRVETVTSGATSANVATSYITTANTEAYTQADGDATIDGLVHHYVVTSVSGTPAGTMTPAHLADGTLHTLTWATAGSFDLMWDSTNTTWRVVGTPRGATVN